MTVDPQLLRLEPVRPACSHSGRVCPPGEEQVTAPAQTITEGTVTPRVRRWPVGKLLTSAVARATAVGAISADYNETHIFNPTWTAHAKFHDAQTITLAGTTAAISLWQLWGPGTPSRSRLHWAAVFGGLFWAPQVPALFFPGTAVVDPDHPTQPFTWHHIPVNQVTGGAVTVVPLLAAGYLLAARRLRS